VMNVRSKGRNLAPDAEVMSSMVRTALTTHVPANIRQSLRMVDHFNHLLSAPKIGVDHLPQPQKVTRVEAFFHEKLAIALEEAVDVLTSMKIGQELQVDEVPRWRHLQTRAKAYLGGRQRDSIRPAKITNVSSGRKPVKEERSSPVPQPSQTLPEGLLVSDTELDLLREQMAKRHAHAKPIARS